MEKDIKDMADGEIGYTVPWAMYKDVSGALWVRGHYLVWPEAGGTATMRVVNRAMRGVEIKALKGEKWDTTEVDNWMIRTWDMIPVCAFEQV